MNLKLCSIFFLAALSACTFTEKSDDFDPRLFHYEMNEQSKSYQDCEIGGPNCTYIHFSFPEFKSDSSIVEKISVSLRGALYEGSQKEPSLICQDFIDEYKSFAEDEFGDEPFEWSWYKNANAEVLLIWKKVISISIKHDNFQGGAHPNLYFNLLNFDPSTGEEISYDHLFSKESQEELIRLLDRELRKQRSLKNDDSLNEDGFWFENDKLVLSENFAFTEQGLLFIYNSYEIAPYAMGIISITLPYGLVTHLFK